MRRTMLIVALAISCSPAWAQRSRAQTPPPAKPAQAEPQRTTATFGDWTLRCVRPDGQPAQCEVSQTVFDKSQPVAQTAIGRPGKTEAMRLTIMVPVNVGLSAAPKLQPGEGDAGVDLAWRRCVPAGCLADAALSDEQVKRLRARSENGRITFQDALGREAGIPFAPKGLGAALDALAKEPS